MDVRVIAEAEVFTYRNAKATTGRRDGGTELYVYRGDDRIAHFAPGRWSSWMVVDSDLETQTSR